MWVVCRQICPGQYEQVTFHSSQVTALKQALDTGGKALEIGTPITLGLDWLWKEAGSKNYRETGT